MKAQQPSDTVSSNIPAAKVFWERGGRKDEELSTGGRACTCCSCKILSVACFPEGLRADVCEPWNQPYCLPLRRHIQVGTADAGSR